MDISDRTSTRWAFIGEIRALFFAGARYRTRVAAEGFRFRQNARGWKAVRRADCSRREENNANNSRDVALRWARAYAANTITLWTRLPFKWKQTWNAKIHRQARPPPATTHETARANATPRSSVCKLCASIVYGTLSAPLRAYQKSISHVFFDGCSIDLIVSGILLN